MKFNAQLLLLLLLPQPTTLGDLINRGGNLRECLRGYVGGF